MKTAALALTIASLTLAGGLASAQQAQPAPQAQQPPPFKWPERMKNAQVLPPETGGEQLRGIMRGFSQALGVRCTHCHVGTEGQPLTTFDFASDAKPKKNVARAMLRMTGRLNREELPKIAGLTEPRVTCFTCHRGAAEPATAPPPAPPPPAAQ